MKYRNTVEFEVYGDYALFSDPVTRVGGEKSSYHVPRMKRLKGFCKACTGSLRCLDYRCGKNYEANPDGDKGVSVPLIIMGEMIYPIILI